MHHSVPERGAARELVELGRSLHTMTEHLIREEEALRAKVDEVERATQSLKEAQDRLVRSERLASVERALTEALRLGPCPRRRGRLRQAASKRPSERHHHGRAVLTEYQDPTASPSRGRRCAVPARTRVHAAGRLPEHALRRRSEGDSGPRFHLCRRVAPR